MTAPKQRHTKSRRDKRRQNLKLKKQTFSVCPKCQSPILPHHTCPKCGYYRGREVIDVLAKLEKKEKKQREREIKQAEREKAPKEKSLSMEELSKKK
ncbi:MAG: 50S ribosomal protein L32 [Patescibacteria group bacterium]